jgi:hypothetical protein
LIEKILTRVGLLPQSSPEEAGTRAGAASHWPSSACREMHAGSGATSVGW